MRGYITHVDLQEVRLDQPIHATVSVTLVGESVGVKEGGVLTQVTSDVTIEALPLEIPEHLELDVSELAIGDTPGSRGQGARGRDAARRSRGDGARLGHDAARRGRA